MSTTLKNLLCNIIDFAADLGLARHTNDNVMAEQVDTRLMAEHEMRRSKLKSMQETVREAMGPAALAHPCYKFNPRHSNDTSVYPHFRQSMLNEIAERAGWDRNNNPDHCRHAARLAAL